MREMIFRGKSIGLKDAGCWVHGFYAQLNDGLRPDWLRHFILTGKLHYNDYYGKEDICKSEIDPETLGQYTGRRDKRGTRVFEGDVVRVKVTENRMSGTHKYTEVYEVAYHTENCYFYLKREKNNLLFDGNWSYFVTVEEVLGNIHDNPELMEPKKICPATKRACCECKPGGPCAEVEYDENA